MALAELSDKAIADLTDIANYYILLNGIEVAETTVTHLLAQIQSLADEYLLKGYSVAGMDTKFRCWTVLENKYYVYFERFENNDILVFRLYSTKRKTLKPKEIRGQ